MDEVTELCDRVLVLKQGTIIAHDTPNALANSVSKVRLHLTIASGLDTLKQYLHDHQISYAMQGHLIIELNEHAVAQFLANLGTQNILYSHISIDKPTLEDYFLSIARSVS